MLMLTARCCIDDEFGTVESIANQNFQSSEEFALDTSSTLPLPDGHGTGGSQYFAQGLNVMPGGLPADWLKWIQDFSSFAAAASAVAESWTVRRWREKGKPITDERVDNEVPNLCPPEYPVFLCCDEFGPIVDGAYSWMEGCCMFLLHICHATSKQVIEKL